jgi:hypothetical protein
MTSTLGRSPRPRTSSRNAFPSMPGINYVEKDHGRVERLHQIQRYAAISGRHHSPVWTFKALNQHREYGWIVVDD